ncbi:MAG: aspartate carbamoyltransferase catalytic subunit [Candidatus Sumerlaeota bacterium]|nr:aspartate carbamoyltransferase catalytic subunit [Candidatus Sumerlaeota bacterium]
MAMAKKAVATQSAAATLQRKDLIAIEPMSREELELILDNAVGFKDIVTRTVKKVPTLRGKMVVNLFFENSTRTRTSFEVAARRLSADVINFDVATSSVNKGESLLDTVETIEALGADIVVIRHASSGAQQFLGSRVAASIINAGDGSHEHPTQALLDCFTIREDKGTLDGLKIAIIGDILHSRVARSNIWAMTKLGAKVTLIGPPTLVPERFRDLGVEVCHDLKTGLRRADVVYTLRIQLERQAKNLFPSTKEYRLLYGIDKERLKWAKSDALVMHPGPANIGVEITRDVMTCPRSRINEQVTNGVAARMAVLYLLRGGAAK